MLDLRLPLVELLKRKHVAVAGLQPVLLWLEADIQKYLTLQDRLCHGGLLLWLLRLANRVLEVGWSDLARQV